MTDYQALIERLEKLSGPSREGDVAIWAAITPMHDYRRLPPGKSYSTWQKRNRAGNWNDYYPSLNAPCYTESVDAAMTLMPDKWKTLRFERHDDGCGCFLDGDDEWGATPAIALCISCLKARMHQEAQSAVEVAAG